LVDTSIKNVAWTFAGLAVPLVVAAATVPELLDRIGTERFGFLALAWGLIGYASILDLGISRAVTQRLAALRAEGDNLQIVRVVVSGIKVATLAGGAGGLLVLLAILLGLHTIVPTTQVRASEIAVAMVLMAIALPIQAVSGTYRGVNEAFGNFVGISLLRIGLGVANFGGPFLVSFLAVDLVSLVATIVVSRVAALGLYRALAWGCVDRQSRRLGVVADRHTIIDLLRFGGWFTVSTTLSPVLGQADRFFVAALISASAVTAYVIPYEVVTQCLILVGAITTVLFPALSRAVALDPVRGEAMFKAWIARVGAGMLVVTSLLAAVMPWLLDIWLRDRVPDQSVVVGRVLCLGVFLNSVGAICFAYLHAHGRVRQTALAHLLEAPVFLVALYLGVRYFGITGAAWAWVFRMFMDTSILLGFVSAMKRERGIG